MKCCVLLAALLLFARPSPAQLLSGTKYDPAIPTLKSIVGHDPGQEISTPDQIGRYLEALAKAEARVPSIAPEHAARARCERRTRSAGRVREARKAVPTGGAGAEARDC